MRILSVLLQVIIAVVIAPLVSGVIRKIKNNMRMRKGPGIVQPYFNLSKLFYKDEVVSRNTSWIFKITPYIVLSSTIAACFLVPFFTLGNSLPRVGDFLVLIFVFGIARFFLALAGLDAASAFGGMGSSREMFISALVEPVAILSAIVVSLNVGSTSLEAISGNLGGLTVSSVIATIALFTVLIAETSRIPVDNQETHLELTMIHEAMVLEYSGRSLAMIELASHIKQIIFFAIVANVIFPLGGCGIFMSFAFFLAKLLIISVIVAFIEISMAKMRLFRAVDFLGFSFVLSVMSLVAKTIGI